jgi:hypothetical protein
MRLVKQVILPLSHMRLVHKGTGSGFHSSQSLDHPSSLSDPLVTLVRGLGHLGGDEHQWPVL